MLMSEFLPEVPKWPFVCMRSEDIG